MAYAANFPNRFSQLILSNAQARYLGHPLWGHVNQEHANQEAFRTLMLSNWRMASLAVLEGWLWSSVDASALQWYLRVRQEGVAPEIFVQLLAQVWNMDVRELLPKVSVPTLVVHYRNDRFVPFEAGRELAAEIPGARFVPLEGDAHLFFFNDTRPLRLAIAEFLGDAYPPR
jgi:pimeloyl-ACP methyl ester carboxylesterase